MPKIVKYFDEYEKECLPELAVMVSEQIIAEDGKILQESFYFKDRSVRKEIKAH